MSLFSSIFHNSNLIKWGFFPLVFWIKYNLYVKHDKTKKTWCPYPKWGSFSSIFCIKCNIYVEQHDNIEKLVVPSPSWGSYGELNPELTWKTNYHEGNYSNNRLQSSTMNVAKSIFLSTYVYVVVFHGDDQTRTHLAYTSTYQM